MRLRAAALAAILSGALAAPAHAQPQAMPFGFSDNAVTGRQLTAGDDAALAARAGATTTRITLDWRWAEPTPGDWRLTTYDAIYAAHVARGIRPVFVLLYAPQWAWAGGVTCRQATQDCRYPPAPDHLDAWGAMVRKIVTRYPQAAGIEVWNEPNESRYWQGGPDPGLYTAMLRTTRDAVEAAGSTMPVLGGALSGANDQDEQTSDRAMSYRRFLRGMYAAGAKGAMDRLSVHPYPGDVDLWRFFKMLTEVRDIRDAAGDAATPLYATEIGTSTTGSGANTLDAARQALILDRMVRDLRAMPDVAGAFVHTLVDVARTAPAQQGRGFGLLGADLTPKPAYCLIARLQGAPYSCPLPAADAVQSTRWAAQELVQAAVDAARRYRRAEGTWAGLTSAGLHEYDGRISATPASATARPAAGADPSRIFVATWGTDGSRVLLCNASRAGRSYCAVTAEGGPWTYGGSTGTIGATAGRTLHGGVWWW